ncbi:unnamed protein product [Closterium sp. Naga37s-1]|nr:unnamed protein product [Closterium sp. Naga37s-1]
MHAPSLYACTHPFPRGSVAACTASRAALWDVRASLSSPAMLFRLPDARRSPATTTTTLKCLAPDPDASVIYGGCSDGAICAWDLRQGTGHLGNHNSFPHSASSSLQQLLQKSLPEGESRRRGASNHHQLHSQTLPSRDVSSKQLTLAAAAAAAAAGEAEATAATAAAVAAASEASQGSFKKGSALVGAQANGSSGRSGKGNGGLSFGRNGGGSGGESEGISGAVEWASGVTERDGRRLVEEGLLAEVERDIDKDVGVHRLPSALDERCAALSFPPFIKLTRNPKRAMHSSSRSELTVPLLPFLHSLPPSVSLLLVFDNDSITLTPSSPPYSPEWNPPAAPLFHLSSLQFCAVVAGKAYQMLVSDTLQQAGTTSSAVQHLSFDPASASRLSFHLNNGWSGVLHVPSLSLSHIHCPPPPWVNTRPEVEEDESLYEYCVSPRPGIPTSSSLI